MESLWQDRTQIEAMQSQRLVEMLRTIIPRNRFWTSKLQAAGVEVATIQSLGDLSKLPLTTKQELVDNQAQQPPYGSNLS